VIEFGADNLPCPRAKVGTGTVESPQYPETAAGRLDQPQRMLPQLLGLVGLQAVDEFMQVAVIMRCRHSLRVRQSYADGLRLGLNTCQFGASRARAAAW
jgi:hypothetical protein